MTEKGVKSAVDNADLIQKKFEFAGPLGRYLQDVRLLISVAKDYWSGNYRAMPWWAMSAIVFALLYVINPVDLIPDFIPVVGYLDDAAVVSVCLVLVEQELRTYSKCKVRSSSGNRN